MRTPNRPDKPKTQAAKPLMVDEAGERLQKVLARIGLASRREIEEWIRNGRITLNGTYAKLGDRYKSGDRVTVNGRVVDLDGRAEEPTRVLLYHKPIGEVVTRRDPEGRPVIFTQLPRPTRGRWIAIGRLDINTQGLLLVTTNGELANRLMHPSREVPREYAVRVLGNIEDRVLDRLAQGVELEDGPAKFESITAAGGEGANRWFHVMLREGRNRIVRRLWDSQGVTVSRLIRIRFANIELPPRLRARTFMELPQEQVDYLLKLVDLPPEVTQSKVANKPPSSRSGATKPPRQSPAQQRPSRR
ncbi:MAG: pseudouridine synthase [Methylococcaceae bacterium]|nr:pseudouridine synthase [Methylococcaceae bacterium]